MNWTGQFFKKVTNKFGRINGVKLNEGTFEPNGKGKWGSPDVGITWLLYIYLDENCWIEIDTRSTLATVKERLEHIIFNLEKKLSEDTKLTAKGTPRVSYQRTLSKIKYYKSLRPRLYNNSIEFIMEA